jgi:hypothetical protein
VTTMLLPKPEPLHIHPGISSYDAVLWHPAAYQLLENVTDSMALCATHLSINLFKSYLL